MLGFLFAAITDRDKHSRIKATNLFIGFFCLFGESKKVLGGFYGNSNSEKKPKQAARQKSETVEGVSQSGKGERRSKKTEMRNNND